MNEVTVDKLDNVDFDKLATPFELDLIDFYKILEEELIKLSEKAKNGMNEEQLIQEINNIFGGEE